MLRIHFLQQWYALSDPAVEEALYDSDRCADSWVMFTLFALSNLWMVRKHLLAQTG